MRTIKYRYWNSNEKRMYFQQSHGWTEFPNTLEKDDVYLEFTGLLDRNGKEIYEEDIVRLPSEGNWLVGWHERVAAFGVISAKEKNAHKIYYFDNMWGLEWRRNWEVIGNIYENSELLE